MTETRVPEESQGAEKSKSAHEPRKLDDVLLAMDVVDTLRHRERIVDMELSAEEREADLIARLREIYDAQGIEVPDRILLDGVKALEEQRFVYKPPKSTFFVKLAKIYVSRSKWLPAATWGSGGLAALAVGWQAFIAGPEAAEWRKLPSQISEISASAQEVALSTDVDERIAAIERAGLRAVEQRDKEQARQQLASLQAMQETLEVEYDLRIVSRPGEDTGFYRVPNENPMGRNYYLVVEPIAPGGELLSITVTSEEEQVTAKVSKWAQRVTQATFDRVAEDKRPDQILQNDILGRKERGELDPTFDTPVPGGVITQW